MRIHRFFTTSTLFPEARLFISGQTAHHLANVLRVKVGQILHPFNGSDGEWRAEILKIKPKHIECLIQTRYREPEHYSRLLVLFFTPLKPHRLEILVEKATELGVTHFVPCQTEYISIRHFNHKRMEAIAISATEQSGRLSPPSFDSLSSLQKHLNTWEEKLPSEAQIFLGDMESPCLLLDAFDKSACSKGILIGPEGGWTDSELTWLRAHPRLTPVSLGPTILRAETAALLSVGILNMTAHQ